MDTLRISTPRLTLRPMVRDDAADLCRIVTMPEVGRMLFLFPPDWTEAAAADFIDTCAWRGELGFRLAIADGAGRFIGSVGVSTGEEPWIFYFLDPDVAGQGLATEAVQAFIAWLFGRFAIRALRADIFTDNPASDRIVTRLGFMRTEMATGTSAGRVEPAPVWLYRLTKEQFKAAPS